MSSWLNETSSWPGSELGGKRASSCGKAVLSRRTGARPSLRCEHRCSGVYPLCRCSPAVPAIRKPEAPLSASVSAEHTQSPAFLTSWEAPAVFLDNLGHPHGAPMCVPHGALPPQRRGSESTLEPEERDARRPWAH